MDNTNIKISHSACSDITTDTSMVYANMSSKNGIQKQKQGFAGFEVSEAV
jgi:hypothetical protein